ncbi:unnamed protein product [Prorocentrum cordatum]|uniref:J domain-containing protein n=1 Tax=Prorocentrum cordatum TaxID=2364126 RepID=A0ABN9PQN1_9DINO|nr:unnamed protein product [Polarella glacialis]
MAPAAQRAGRRRWRAAAALALALALGAAAGACGPAWRPGLHARPWAPATGGPQTVRAGRAGRRAVATENTASQQVLDALEEFEGDWNAPFELLDLDDVEASKKDIRAAFRNIARKEHPDVSDRPDAEERFRRISLAYELLLDDGGRSMLLEAMERKVEDLDELEDSTVPLDEGMEAWDDRWVEDEFTGVFRAGFLAILIPTTLWLIWWFAFDHD